MRLLLAGSNKVIVKLLNKNSDVYNSEYKGIPIKADRRIHDEIFRIFSTYVESRKSLEILDVATGKGALAQRIIDEFPNFSMDCNDIDRETLCRGFKKMYHENLDEDFNFDNKYDVILAVEVIEHLQNPFHFIKNLNVFLKPGGVIFLSTPSVDSLFDRLWFLYAGHPYYFGEKAIESCGGHITICPEWLLQHIAKKESLRFGAIENNIDSYPIIGRLSKFLLRILHPLRFFIVNPHDSSVLICYFKK